MGDSEFEAFLDGKDDQDNGNDFYSCKKRLLFDILQLKIENSTNLLGIFSELLKDNPKEYKSKIAELTEISESSFEQLDMLLGEVLDDFKDGDN